MKNPSKDFSRNRKLSFESIIKILIGMGGNSSCKEIKFHPKHWNISCDEQILFKGYPLLAVDGADIRFPKNKNNSDSYFRNDESTKEYHFLHLDAMYDLMQHIYVDASIQNKEGMNEHKALVSMLDKSEISGNVIVIADRGYESFNNIAHF